MLLPCAQRISESIGPPYPTTDPFSQAFLQIWVSSRALFFELFCRGHVYGMLSSSFLNANINGLYKELFYPTDCYTFDLISSGPRLIIMSNLSTGCKTELRTKVHLRWQNARWQNANWDSRYTSD